MNSEEATHWLVAFNLGIALGYPGLIIKAAVDDLLWRADVIAFYTGWAIVRQKYSGLPIWPASRTREGKA